ncbi:transposase C of IS166 homeodomain protein [Burkholderia ubonensis MSMB22]|nr:transposase C of IS166 homeodomain protein [Burkholderia ubonensis MSMB22]
MSAEHLRALAMELMSEVRAKDSELRFKEARIAQLTHEMAVLKRWKFAARSEKLAAEQQSLLDEAVDADLIAIEQELEQLADRPKKDAEPNKPRRAPLPANLPHVEVRHELASTTCACGCQRKTQCSCLDRDLSVILWARHIMRVKNHGYADEEEETNGGLAGSGPRAAA